MADSKATAVKPKFRVLINQGWCKGCGICSSFCPKGILIPEGLDQKVQVTDESLCSGCRMCEVHCPDFAIDVASDDEEIAA